MSRVLTATRVPCPKCGGRAYRLQIFGGGKARKAQDQSIECRAGCAAQQQGDLHT